MTAPNPRDRSIDAPEPDLTDEELVEDDDSTSAGSRDDTAPPRRLPIDAPEADALDQAMPADLDDDDR